MSPLDQDSLILTTSNLQKHTTTSLETPRTKIMRYLNHQLPEHKEEDSQVLKMGSSSSAQMNHPSPWDPTLDFMPGKFISQKLPACNLSEYLENVVSNRSDG
jgi:hypothetical protein